MYLSELFKTVSRGRSDKWCGAQDRFDLVTVNEFLLLRVP